MDPIKNAGVTDYMSSLPQNNANQIQGYNDYSSIPMVYEPEVEVKKKASSNMLGMTALGITAAVVGGLVGKKMGSKGLKEVQAAADDAIKNYNAIAKEKEALAKAKEEAQKSLDKERTLSVMERLKRLFNPNSGLTKEEKEARAAAKKAKNEAQKAEKNSKKEAQKAEKTENKAENKTEKTETENK